MLKKSTSSRIRSLIYPSAFILIIILSALYKFVFKGDGQVSVQGFKTGRSVPVTGTLATDSRTADGTLSSSPEETNISQTEASVQLISVYICGEVNVPGIYNVPKGAILNDIIEDAGGLTGNASVNNINFVYQITGNMSVYIPSKDEISGGFSGGDIIRQDGVYVWGSHSSGPDGTGGGTELMVNINTASSEELKKLPGIGEVTAQAIIDYRKDNPFEAAEDIKNVTGIGDSKYNRIKDYICV